MMLILLNVHLLYHSSQFKQIPLEVIFGKMGRFAKPTG